MLNQRLIVKISNGLFVGALTILVLTVLKIIRVVDLITRETIMELGDT